jgi:3-hydroxyacyl-CoA dehydrogenase / enoyl-CoA hydratase / 3-hydroxybutyryl-CoA epimerase
MTSTDPPTAASPRLNVDEEGLARITFDDPERRANVLTEPVMRRLAEVVDEVAEGVEEGRIQGVLVESGKQDSFIVGADIDAIAEIEDPDTGAEAARLGQAIFLALEELTVPTVAAIHGPCMGGGTELALSCRYRVASDHERTSIGLPEVQLGILPAWGGTTRLPRLLGLQNALDLLLTGKTVDGSRARKLGLVEEVLPHAIFQEAATDFLRARVVGGPVPTGARRNLARRLLEDTAPGRRLILRAARNKVRERTGDHYPAPHRILDVVHRSFGRSVEEALSLEAEAAGELLASRVSKHLVHIFQMRDTARKGKGVEGPAEPREVSNLGVVGAGVMGGGIAQLAAYQGLQVRIKDIRHDAVSEALQYARGLFDKAVERRKMGSARAREGMNRISGGLDYSGFGQVDLVVEAVVERMDVKQEVLAEVEERVSGECILTTNTSTLSVDEMAQALSRPENFCGMHFFNPVHRMPLVEVVRGERSSDSAVATVYALAVKLGKVPVVVKDGPGFLVNRVLSPYLNEAGHLLAEGARMEKIDGAATAFGMPMGPLRLVDEVGIDVARHAGQVLHEAFGERMAPAEALVRMGESERLGKKGGSGFYRYEDGKSKGPDPEVYRILGDVIRTDAPLPDESDIRARLILMMINEAARVLDEGLVRAASQVDLAMVMGTGFPPFRGGLLLFADEIHPRSLVERLETYEGKLGPRFAPAALLRRLAREDRGFYDTFPADRTSVPSGVVDGSP